MMRTLESFKWCATHSASTRTIGWVYWLVSTTDVSVFAMELPPFFLLARHGLVTRAGFPNYGDICGSFEPSA
jgi:hypothetical protein